MSKSNGLFLSLIFLLISLPNAPVLGEQNNLHRPDPLRHLKPFHGGFDVRNRHYWASAAFTGVHGFAIAGVWILGGLGFGIFVIVRNLRCHSYAISERSDWISVYSFWVVVLFTFLAIALSGTVLAANRNWYRRAKKMKETFLSAAENAFTTIRKVTGATNEMHRLLCPYDKKICYRSKSTSKKLERESTTILRIAYKNRRSMDLALTISYGATAAVASINLVLIVVALVMLLLHFQAGFITIILICWILTALCWIITGCHYFLHTFTADTCSALEEYKESPDHNSLRSILPCFNAAAADRIMVQIGSGIHNFITKVRDDIDKMAHIMKFGSSMHVPDWLMSLANTSRESSKRYSEQLNSKITKLDELFRLDEVHETSLRGLFKKVCDPFSGPPEYRYNPRRCSNNTIPIGEITHILKQMTCPGDNPSTGACIGIQKFISKAAFDMAEAYTLSIQGMLDVFPDLQSLTHCSFVKETFSDILSHQCGPLKGSIWLLWSLMVSLSTVTMALEVAWIAKAYQDRGRYISRGPLPPTRT